MADTKATEAKGAGRLTGQTATLVSRNIIGTKVEKDAKGVAVMKDGKPSIVPKTDANGNMVTKDGQDHGCTALLAQMRPATSQEEVLASLAELFATVAAINGFKPVDRVDSKGNAKATPPSPEFADGKTVLIAGKDIYPNSFADIPALVNEAIQQRCAGAMTTYNNKFKSSYGGGAAAPSATPLDDLDI